LINPVSVPVDENTPEAFSDVNSHKSLIEMITKVLIRSNKTIEDDTDEDSTKRSGSTSSFYEAANDEELCKIHSFLEEVMSSTRDSQGSPVPQRAALPVKSPARRLLSEIPPKAPQRRGSNDALNMAELRKELPLHRDVAPKSPSASEVRVLARDLLPRMPSRRAMGSPLKDLAELDEQEELIDKAAIEGGELFSSTGSSSGSTPQSADQIESYVMSSISGFLKEKLPKEAWKQIYSVVAEREMSSCSAGSRESSEHEIELSRTLLVDELPTGAIMSTASHYYSKEISSFVSEITTPTGLKNYDETSSLVSGVTNQTTLCSKSTQNKSRHNTRSSLFYDIHSRRPTNQADSLNALRPPSIPMPPSWYAGTVDTAPRVPSRPRDKRQFSEPSMSEPPVRPEHNQHQSASVTMLDLKKPIKRHVVFATVQIRHYERILDVNPSTSSGPSLGIGWRYIESFPVGVDDLDDTNKSPCELWIPWNDRECILIELGYSRQDIAQAVRRSWKLKNQRRQTVNNLFAQKVEYLVEKSRRKVGACYILVQRSISGIFRELEIS
jgi:hypothetical protein